MRLVYRETILVRDMGWVGLSMKIFVIPVSARFCLGRMAG